MIISYADAWLKFSNYKMKLHWCVQSLYVQYKRKLNFLCINTQRSNFCISCLVKNTNKIFFLFAFAIYQISLGRKHTSNFQSGWCRQLCCIVIRFITSVGWKSQHNCRFQQLKNGSCVYALMHNICTKMEFAWSNDNIIPQWKYLIKWSRGI